MDKAPFITVAVTTYNRCDLLAEAIESVLQQSFSDYELLVIDDASPDNTEQVVKRYIEQSTQPIRYFRQPMNRGASAARNEALNRAGGDFIVYLDDDDRFAPGFLSTVGRALWEAPPTLTFVVPGIDFVRVSATGDVLLNRSSFGKLTEAQLLPGIHYFATPFGGGTGLVVRISAAHAVGGWKPELIHGEDIDFMMRLALRGDFLVLPEARILLCTHEGPQLTKDFVGAAKARERLADDYASILRRYPEAHARLYNIGARMFYGVKMRREGRRCIAKALRVAPFSWSSWRRFLLYEVSGLLPLAKRQRLFRDFRHGYLATS